MSEELIIYFESGCNAILAATKHIMDNYNILSFCDADQDFSRCGMNINMNNEVEIVLKSYLSPLRVPIFNVNQVNLVYNDTSVKKDLYYWMINTGSHPTKATNRDRDFSISLVLMHDQKLVLSIISIPLEDKIYFEYSDKGVFVIEGLMQKRYDPPVKYLLNMARPI